MFLDHATIDVSGGKGGDGRVGWRREKYVPLGGPAGGDGGKGGDVIVIADDNTDTLSDYAARKRFRAEDGEVGMMKMCHGKDGDDLLLPVPPGTVVTDADTGTVYADLKTRGDRYIVAKGGRGGYGNAHFKSSTRRKPDFAEQGEPGVRTRVSLELKLVADVGIVGYPSTGKSTLISVVSSARPKIADYPFTTLVPNLGVVRVDTRHFVLCDVPGLIEGASEGKGLGDKFLRHIERCGIIIHLLDLGRALRQDGSIDTDALLHDYKAIRKELEAYSPTLLSKHEFVVINKTDLTTQRLAPVLAQLKKHRISIAATISAATAQGTDALMKKILPTILAARKERISHEEDSSDEAAVPVLRPHLESIRMKDFSLESTDAALIVHGKRIEQFASMTNFDNPGGLRRFRDVLKKLGLIGSLRRAHAAEKKVCIGSTEIGQYLS